MIRGAECATSTHASRPPCSRLAAASVSSPSRRRFGSDLRVSARACGISFDKGSYFPKNVVRFRSDRQFRPASWSTASQVHPSLPAGRGAFTRPRIIGPAATSAAKKTPKGSCTLTLIGETTARPLRQLPGEASLSPPEQAVDGGAGSHAQGCRGRLWTGTALGFLVIGWIVATGLLARSDIGAAQRQMRQ